MIGRASQLLAIRKPEAHDGLNAISHDCEWPGGNHSLTWLLRSRAVGVDPELFPGLRALVQILEGEEPERGVHPCVTREARV
jgi:hypothetical protein